MKSKKIISLLILLLTLCFIPINTLAQDNTNSNNDAIETISYSGKDDATTYANDIRWRYKIVNGILYRRQYDYTTERWIGEWERVK